MYTKSVNPQALQSRQMIQGALLSLMENHLYNDITITQICQEAEVVRQTFYRNFKSKEDVLEFYIDNMVQQFMSGYLNLQDTMHEVLKSFFDFMIINKDFLRLMEKNSLFFLLENDITIFIPKIIYIPKITEELKAAKLDIYVLGFIASTVCSILSLWVKTDFKESSDMLADLAGIFFSGLEN